MAYGVRLHSDDELVSAALLLARYLLQFLRIYAIMKQHRQHRAVSAVQNSTKIVFDNGQINWNEDDNIPYHAIDASLDATKCHCGAKEMQTECICGRGSRTVDPVLFLPKTSRPFTVTEPSFSTMSTMTPTAPMDNPFPTVTSEDSDIVNNDPSTLFLPTEKKPTLWERTANILLRGKKIDEKITKSYCYNCATITSNNSCYYPFTNIWILSYSLFCFIIFYEWVSSSFPCSFEFK